MNSPDDVIGPVNLGNPQEMPIGDLAQRIINVTGSRGRIVYEPLPQDDPRKRRPDITKARQLLGWEPSTPLEQGLQQTISYFQQLLHKDSG